MVVKELFARLGLDVDEAAFAVGEKAIGAVRGGMIGLAAVAGALVGGMAAAVMGVVNAAGELDDLSQRTGLTTTMLQELKFAGEQTGVGLEGLTQGLLLLGRNATEASRGGKTASAAFARIGVSVKDASGEVRQSDAILRDVADRFAAMDNPTEKAALAMDLFGRSGVAMVPLLNRGGAGIEDLRIQAHELGLVMSEEMVAAGDEVGDNLNALQFALGGLRNAVAGPLMKDIAALSTAFIAWYRANRQLVTSRIERFFGLVRLALRGLWLVAKPFLLVMGFLLDNLKLVAAVAGGVLLAALIANAGAIATAVSWYAALGGASVLAAGKAALAWVAAAWPVLALVAALALIILIIEDVMVALEGGDSMIMKLGAKWTAFLDSWLQNDEGDGWLMTAFKALVWMFTDLGERVPSALAEWKQMIGGFFSWLWERAKEVAAGMGSALAGAARMAVEALPGGRLVTGMMGGGSSPAASVGASVNTAGPTVLAPSFRGDFVTHAAPGMSPQEVAGATRDTMDEWFTSKLQQSFVAVDQ